MDSFEFNKIAAAVLVTILVIIGVKEVANEIFHVKKPKQSAYKIEGVETKEEAKTETAKAEEKGPTTPVNEFDGTVHANGNRYFPEDGKKVGGVNLRLPQAQQPSLRLTQIPKIRSFA